MSGIGLVDELNFYTSRICRVEHGRNFFPFFAQPNVGYRRCRKFSTGIGIEQFKFCFDRNVTTTTRIGTGYKSREINVGIRTDAINGTFVQNVGFRRTIGTVIHQHTPVCIAWGMVFCYAIPSFGTIVTIAIGYPLVYIGTATCVTRVGQYRIVTFVGHGRTTCGFGRIRNRCTIGNGSARNGYVLLAIASPCVYIGQGAKIFFKNYNGIGRVALNRRRNFYHIGNFTIGIHHSYKGFIYHLVRISGS